MKATIQTLTPIHIGNGTTYNKNIDFIQAGSKIGIVDDAKVLNYIGEENLHQWIAAIERGNNEFIGLLKGRGLVDDDLEKICKRMCRLRTPNHQSTQLKEHYRTSMTGVTIPGSSLKGCMKTAILDFLTGQDSFVFNIDEIKFPRLGRGQSTTVADWKDSSVDKRLFGDTANDKSTRFLKIGDMSFPEAHTEIHEIKILNIENDVWVFKPGQHFLAEAIPAGSKAEFSLSIDELHLQRNQEKNPGLWPKEKMEPLSNGYQSLCNIINDFTTSLIKWELDLLKNEDLPVAGDHMLDHYKMVLGEIEKCTPSEFVIRIGANSGWIFMTGGWWRRFTENISDDDLSSLRMAIQKKYYHDMDLWPKTRKISTSGQIFGFVKVSRSIP